MNKIDYKSAISLAKTEYFLKICKDPTVFVNDYEGDVYIDVYDEDGFLRSQYVPTFNEIIFYGI